MARILLVDDDAEEASRNASALTASGHAVAIATTAAAAEAAVHGDVPDAVVLEGVLGGGMGGFDLARTLARTLPHLPLIMLTRADEILSAADLASQDRDGGWLPVERYLEKPVMPEVLAYEVDHVLHKPA
jgi:CheY-like chemotaxis protein